MIREFLGTDSWVYLQTRHDSGLPLYLALASYPPNRFLGLGMHHQVTNINKQCWNGCVPPSKTSPVSTNLAN